MAVVGRLFRPIDGVGAGDEPGDIGDDMAGIVRIDRYRRGVELVAIFVEDGDRWRSRIGGDSLAEPELDRKSVV